MIQKRDSVSLSVLSNERAPAPGDRHGERSVELGRVPVLCCEGACLAGDIARLTANQLGKATGFARACHAEAFMAPGSGTGQWVQQAGRIVVVDGCSMRCHGTVAEALFGADRIIHYDIMPMYPAFDDAYQIDDVPEPVRKAVADSVAERLLKDLKVRLKDHNEAYLSV